ncbi:FAD-dependent monooxygenase [Pedococcus dokdonensis]|nr:FAD-dependent monooxygenase [Pedococcus dokdonensis]
MSDTSDVSAVSDQLGGSTPVTVVGAGPTGLMLAGELALAGVPVVVLERRQTPDLVGTRARGFHARTVELFDQRGIAERFLNEGNTFQAMSFAGIPLDVGALPSRHNYTLGLSQGHVERILREWVAELGVAVRFGVEVRGLTQDDAGVDVALADGGRLHTAYLVGADGGRSIVRRAAGLEMVGAPATRSHLIGEAEVTQDPVTGLRQDDIGIHGINVVDGQTVGFVVTERELGPATEPTPADLRAALVAVYGTDFGVRDPAWLSRFTDATSQATAYRSGRVLIAGDAAHVHPPTGGQGIGLGVQDAVNLGWKLAQVAHGVAQPDLLDTYFTERHPATARVLHNVVTQALLQKGDARTEAVRATFAEVLGSPGPRAQLAGLLSGLDVAYDLGAGGGEGHPLLGRRVPDLDLVTANGPRRAFELLHAARPVLLDLGEPGVLDVTRWRDRVDVVRAETSDDWVLPVIGPVPTPRAVLVRPDGHVAWVGEGTADGLDAALARWFGPPAD